MSAVISADGLYRYWLERVLPGPYPEELFTVAWIMVNPSTADAELDDPTIRRVVDFTARLGGHRALVGNLFAYQTPYVSLLNNPEIDAIGPENDHHLAEIMHASQRIIVAWGALGKQPPRLRQRYKDVLDIARRVGCPLHCLGTALDGHPRHPLMLPKTADLIAWEDPTGMI